MPVQTSLGKETPRTRVVTTSPKEAWPGPSAGFAAECRQARRFLPALFRRGRALASLLAFVVVVGENPHELKLALRLTEWNYGFLGLHWPMISREAERGLQLPHRASQSTRLRSERLFLEGCIADSRRTLVVFRT